MSAVPVLPPHVHQRTPRIRPAWDKVSAAFVLAAGVVVAFTLTQHKASLKKLTEMPLTVVGAGCIDFAAFHLGNGWGFLVTGLSLILIEHLIADE
jgi:hypothetical protein